MAAASFSRRARAGLLLGTLWLATPGAAARPGATQDSNVAVELVKADFAAVQGFILLCGAFAVLIHLLHGAARRVARLRIRRA